MRCIVRKGSVLQWRKGDKEEFSGKKSMAPRSRLPLLFFSTAALFLSLKQIFLVSDPSAYCLLAFKESRVNFHVFVVAENISGGVRFAVFAKDRPNLRRYVVMTLVFLGGRRGVRQAWRAGSLGFALSLGGRDRLSARSGSRCCRRAGGFLDLVYFVLRRRRWNI